MNWFVEWWQFMFSSFWVWLGSLLLIVAITSPAYSWFKIVIQKTKTLVDSKKKEEKQDGESKADV